MCSFYVPRVPLIKISFFFFQFLLKHFLLDLFMHPRQELSDDERDDNEDENDDEKDDKSNVNNNDEDSDEKENTNNASSNISNNSKSTRSERARRKKDDVNSSDSSGGNKKNANTESTVSHDKEKDEITVDDVRVLPNRDGRKTPLHLRDLSSDESYSLIMCNNNWYLFLRLHQILCDRLTKIYNQSVIITNEETASANCVSGPLGKESTAVALRLKPKSELINKNVGVRRNQERIMYSCDCSAFSQLTLLHVVISAFFLCLGDCLFAVSLSQPLRCVTLSFINGDLIFRATFYDLLFYSGLLICRQMSPYLAAKRRKLGILGAKRPPTRKQHPFSGEFLGKAYLSAFSKDSLFPQSFNSLFSTSAHPSCSNSDFSTRKGCWRPWSFIVQISNDCLKL